MHSAKKKQKKSEDTKESASANAYQQNLQGTYFYFFRGLMLYEGIWQVFSRVFPMAII